MSEQTTNEQGMGGGNAETSEERSMRIHEEMTAIVNRMVADAQAFGELKRENPDIEIRVLAREVGVTLEAEAPAARRAARDPRPYSEDDAVDVSSR